MTTRLAIDNIWTRIESDNIEFLNTAEKIASYRQQNWEQARKAWLKKLERAGRNNESDWEYKRAIEWDGWRFIGEYITNDVMKIPTGCLTMVLDVGAALHEKMTFVNDRRRPVPLDVEWRLKDDKRPRDYQDDVFGRVVDAGGRGVVQSPTGSGKTFMIAHLITHYKTTTLIKVPRLVIMDQIIEELKELTTISEEHIGFIGRSKYEPSLVTVVTNSSLYNLKKDPKKWHELVDLHPKHQWGLLIEDEVHHGASKTSYEPTMSLDTFHKIGFSATALDRQDGENIKIIGAYGQMICDVPVEELIENGYLVRPTVKFLPTRPVPTSRSDGWMEVYNMAIVFNSDRNIKMVNIANMLEKQERSTLVFVSRIDHGEELLRLCKMNGVDADFAHGTHPEREDIISRFKNRELAVMIATEGIIGEGFNFKGLNGIIIGDGGKSFIKTIQKPGRGTRPEDGKDDLLVYDFADRGKYVGDHSRERKADWIDYGFEVDITDTPWLR